MLIDENGVPRTAAAPRLSEFLRKKLERFVPAHTLEQSFATRRRPTIAIRIIKTLQGGLSAGAKRATIYGMVGISLKLDGSSVAGLADDAARRRAFATGRRVIGGHTGYCLIRRHQIRNELFDFLGGASQHCGGGGADAKYFQEFASLHSIRSGGHCGLG